MSWRQLYSFTSNYFELGSHRIHYVDENPSGSSEVLLMVHGNPTWSFYFREIIRHFAATHRCIAVDHLGMGLSDKPSGIRYDLELHMDNLVQFIESNELTNVHLMVHDWGGPIGIGAALRCLDRFKRFTITNTAAFPPPYVPARIAVCRIPIIGSLLMKGFNVFPKAALKMATEQPGGLKPQIASGFVAPYDRWANRNAVHDFVLDIPRSRRDKTWQLLEQMEQDLVKLRDLPVQLIWGMKDWCFRPECLERFSDAIPDASVVEIESAGHYVNEDALDAVLEAMDDFVRDRS